MERYRNIVQVEKMKELLQEQKKRDALAIAETINKNKLKSMSDLGVIAEVYFQNKQYDKAKEYFLKIYEKSPTRRILAQLVHLSIQMKDIEDAEKYLNEFTESAPYDFYRHIFRYSLDKMKGKTYEVLIPTLEALKKDEYMDKWAYELIKHYHKAGMGEKCVAECNELILWFGSGDYVDRAKALKSYYLGELSLDDVQSASQTVSTQMAATAEPVSNGSVTEVEYELEDEPQEKPKQKLEETVVAAEWEEQEPKQVLDERKEQDESPKAGDIKPEEKWIEKWIDKRIEEFSVQQETTPVLQEATLSNQNTATALQIMDADEQIAVNEKAKEFVQPKKRNPDLTNPSEDSRLFQVLQKNNLRLEQYFGYHASIDPVRRELIRVLEIALNPKQHNLDFVISGEQESECILIAKGIIKLLNSTGCFCSSKFGKIHAEKINRMNFAAQKDKLSDTCVVIQQAGTLTNQAVESLLKLEQSLDGHIVICLLDTRNQMNQLMREYEELNQVFLNKIHLPVHGLEDWMGFAMTYISEKDYNAEQSAVGILKAKIKKLHDIGSNDILGAIYTFLDRAMIKSDNRNAENLLRLTLAGKIAEGAQYSLCAEDFEASS